MMEGRPIKFRMLELFDENGAMWNNEVVDKLAEEYDMTDRYGRDCINFDLIEMEASGFIKAVDMVDDAEGRFREGYFLTRYQMTSLGRSQYDELVSKSGK